MGKEKRKRENKKQGKATRNRSEYSMTCGCTYTFNERKQNTWVTKRRRGMEEYTAEGFLLQGGKPRGEGW